MICGVLYLQIIDAIYGSSKHGVPSYTAIAIGTEHEDGTVNFIATFNILDPYSKLHFEIGDSISGSMYVSYVDDEASKRKQIVTLVPIDKDYLKTCINNKESIQGKAVLEYTPNHTVIDVVYELNYKKHKAYIHRVLFNVNIEDLKQTQRVITNIEKARLCEL